MKFKIHNALIPMNVLVIVLIIAIAFLPFNWLRIALGLLFLLFTPGYASMAAIYPGRDGVNATERILLSFLISIVVVVLIGYILDFTPLGIGLEPVLYSVATFIFSASIIAWLRCRRLSELERFNVNIEVQFKAPSWGGGALDRVLRIILVVVILGALGTLGYVIAMPKIGERFTEFYILGLNGKTDSYVSEVKVGEGAELIVGIVNHEREVVSYRVEVKIDGVKNNEVGPVVLANEEKWEEILSFMPDKRGEGKRVEFVLYKDEEVKPYLGPLHLWVNVSE